MDLNTLAQILRTQAGRDKAVTFNSDFLDAAQAGALRAAFGLAPSADLTIEDVAPGDIPDPAGATLTLAAGTVDILKQTKLPVEAVFSIDGGTLQFTLRLDFAADWAFPKSFADLTQFPFDETELSESCVVYATRAAGAYPPWPSKPGEDIVLAEGLNLASWIKLDVFEGALALLEEIVSGTDHVKFFGPVTVAGTVSGTIADIATPLTGKTFPIVPGKLTIGNLSLALVQPPSVMGIQMPMLALQASTQDLVFQVGMPQNSAVIGFHAEPAPGHSFGIPQILALPFGSSFQPYIPDALSHAFDAALLQSFDLMLAKDRSVAMIGFAIGSNPGFVWDLIPQVLALTALRFELALFDPAGSGTGSASFAASAQILPSVFTGEFDFTIDIEKSGGKWSVASVTGAYVGDFKLGDLVQGIVGSSAHVPEALNDLSFQDFGATAVHSGSEWAYSVHGTAVLAMPIMDTTLLATLTVTADHSASGYQMALGGTFVVGQQNFALELDLGGTSAVSATDSAVLKASWTALTDDAQIEFKDIAEAFGFSGEDLPDVPKGLDLALKSAALTYDFTRQQLVIALESANYGNADFVAVKNAAAGKWQFFFGLNIDKPIPISTLPLIGDLLPAEDVVEIKQIQVIAASAPFDDALATSVNAMIAALKGGYPTIPDVDKKGMDAGFGFAMTVAVGSFTIPIAFGAGQTRSTETLPEGATAHPAMPLPAARVPMLAAGAPVGASAASDGVVWFNLQKTFGPVAIDKIGVQYKNGVIFVLSNLSISAGGLTVGLIGLGIGSPITDFDPQFTISGLDVSYSGPGVLISGGLLGSIDPVNFVGELMVSAEGFGISGLAGYASIDGAPSLFLYAVLNATLGGPPAFFVTGIAAGFGFNRDLEIPDVSGVATFPLVEWAQGQAGPPGMNPAGDIGKQVDDVLQRLASGGLIAPRAGEYWLAAGVRFTSFELINAFALAVIKFGQSTEVDLMGTAIIAVPPLEPVIYADLQLLASFRPDDGFVGISGQLTPQSYILAPACKLTGGFAYWFWYDGPKAGNFIATLGGYNPHFDVPDFYPRVPRIGVNWNVTDDLVIKGEGYFAVTSSAVMAGGGLSAVWSSGPISAWFNVQADFLMVYQPFHYYIDASIDIGASVRISLIFTHITVTIHVGASVEIWGPDFTGRATVDLDIVSFTISFGGSGQKRDKTVGWKKFATEMLPGGSGSSARALLSASDTSQGVVRIDVTQGLVKTVSSDPSKLDFVVNAEKVEFTVRSSIPIRERDASFIGLVKLAPEHDQPKDQDGKPIPPNTDFGVGPVGRSAKDFTPTFSIAITLTNPKIDAAANEGPLITLECVRILSNAPNALWKKVDFNDNGVPQVGDPLSDTALADVVHGYRIVPVKLKPDHTLPIDLEYLLYTIAPEVPKFIWSTAFVPLSDSLPPGTVETTIESAAAKANRAALLPVLNAFLPSVAASDDVASLGNGTKAGLLAQPLFRLLGEEKAAA